MSKNKLLLYAAITTGVIITVLSTQRRRRKRSVWCRPWIQRRMEGKGVVHMVENELRVEDPIAYKNFLRLTTTQFDQLVELISPYVKKKDTVMRCSVTVESKLSVTLRFLATGETFRSLMYSSRIHETTISRLVPGVCTAIIECLKMDYLKTPTTVEEWKVISNDFNNMWQFPHCLGALDGRHITFRVPISAGAFYRNYKSTNSIVLLGLVDAKYRFLYVNIGVNGRISHGGVFQQSNLCKTMSDNSINFPEAEPIDEQYNLPYVIVADEAFPLSANLLKPYPERFLSPSQRVFNYRLSRARRIVENAFGILANRFRVLLNPINLSVDKTETITLCCVVLHNYLATNNALTYTDFEEELQELPRIGRQCGNRTSHSARDVREMFKNFFNSSVGAVSWQGKSVRTHNF